MGRECNTSGRERNLYRVLMVKPVSRRPLRSLKLRWEDNIKMELGSIGRNVMDWMYLGQDSDQ
jgi:hypothetical protein